MTTADRKTDDVVTGLVGAGLIDPSRHDEAASVVRTALGPDGPSPDGTTPLRRRMAEIAGYVGAAFVVGAATLFVSAAWDDLGLTAQVGVLVGIAALLAGAGAVLTLAVGGRSELAADAEAVRRRLTSVLLTGAAGSTAFGVGLLLGDRMGNDDLAVMLASLAGLVVALGGYVVAPTTVGQLGIVIPAFVAIPTGLSALRTDSSSTVPFGLLVLVLGATWLVLAERGVWREVLSARVIGCVVALTGAQIPIFDEHAWVAYVATAVVGAAAFWLYVLSRAWPYLAAGVVGATVAVPEALYDWAEGSLGAAGVLLVTGVTLLLTALAGLRLRREVTEG